MLPESQVLAAMNSGAPAGTESSAPAGSLNPAAGETGAPGFIAASPLKTKPVSSRSMLIVSRAYKRIFAFCRCDAVFWSFRNEAKRSAV